MKTWIISIMVICLVMVTCAMTFPAAAEDFDRGEFYPHLTVVVDTLFLKDSQVIVCEDRYGYRWTFYDLECEWSIGDIANLLMWNHNGIIEDDEIVEVYWAGYTEDLNEFFQMMGWHD